MCYGRKCEREEGGERDEKRIRKGKGGKNERDEKRTERVREEDGDSVRWEGEDVSERKRM